MDIPAFAVELSLLGAENKDLTWKIARQANIQQQHHNIIPDIRPGVPNAVNEIQCCLQT